MAKVVRTARRVAIAEFEENGPRVQITTTKPYQKALLAAGLTRRNEKQLVERLETNLAAKAKAKADNATFLASLVDRPKRAPRRSGKKSGYRHPVRITVQASAAETRRIAEAARQRRHGVKPEAVVDGLAGLDLGSLDLSALA